MRFYDKAIKAHKMLCRLGRRQEKLAPRTSGAECVDVRQV